MKIHNIRLGFATNSSSSHSIIFAPGNNVTDDYDGGFGWDYFTLASKEAKNEYMKAMLYQNLSVNDAFSEHLIKLIMIGLNLGEPELDEYGYFQGIDHQSLYTLPMEFGTKSISIDFFKEFQDYLLQDGMIVLGGNDNSDEDHSLYDPEKDINFALPVDECYDITKFVCRKDDDWWTIFNRSTGNRIVLSFKQNPAPYKPLTPTLIDFSISDYCTIGCTYCYKGSTKNGAHMRSDDIYRFISDIKQAEVFEVAIGGGEPTQCPYLIPMLKSLKDAGIVGNFTTKSTEWLENESEANEILPLIGAFAYSATDTKPLDRILTIFNYRNYDKNKFTAQVIPATMSKYQFKRILEWCGRNTIRITLLGFKETGRGVEFKRTKIKTVYDKFDEESWLDIIKEIHREGIYPTIAIDTTLAARYEDKLHEENIAKYLYHIEEGKYSAYIDAVSMKFGPSSYHPNKLIDYPERKYERETIKELFAQIESI